ncbi:site-specific DNA-methyltransferase [bacterium]|nr:site-specific DNA-methyltransferase [candidate division CSSED10-310 bacterium]
MIENQFVHPRSSATIRLIQADCLEGMKAMEDQSVSVVVTSPPYNLGIQYNSYDDTVPRAEYLDWIDRWSRAVARILSHSGSLFLNVGASPRDPWIAMDVARRIGHHLTLQNTLHWIKSISIDAEYLRSRNPGSDTLSLGHYKPINSHRFVNDCHEYIFHFTATGDVPLDRKAAGVPFQDKSNVHRWKHASDDLRCRGNTLFIPYPTITSRKLDRPHPATFPEKLVRHCLVLHGLDRVRLVVDPFVGLGTTAVVCVDLGLNCSCFELDPVYMNEAVHRVADRLKAVTHSRTLL